MIMFDESLREGMAESIDFLLYPLIGFGGEYPILTIVLAGLIMITITTTIRDLMMDWVDMAKKQHIVSKTNKALFEAKRANKQSQIKKLEKKKEENSKKQMQTFLPQLKSMAVTMVIVLVIFGWIWLFVDGLPNTTYSVPWAFNAKLENELPYCLFPHFPQWIGVKMLLSLPFTQVLMVVLKWMDFKKRLKEE